MDVATKKKRSFKEGLVDRLHHPLQLRAGLCLALLGGWYWFGYAPMSDRISTTTANLARDRRLLALATEVEALRAEAADFADRIPPRSDPNEFLRYVLDGIRSGPLKLVSLSPQNPKDAGPYEVAMVKVELEGKYQDVDGFFGWVEGNKRLIRVDDLSAVPDSKDPHLLRVQLSVVGLMGVEAKAEPSKAATKEVAPGGKASAKKPATPPNSPGPAASKPAGKPAGRKP